ncbi:MAG: 4-hydroxy-tetrahydrodipicolinate synthase [Magnetococcales bacterium]|nr:4-hydroxy-tetrahydrodipicolinate synthase [Magnetococcales bacterium]
MFEGVLSALITPFKEDRLDVEALERLIEFQIDGGIHGIVPCGTTGESATLTHAEHKDVIGRTVEIVNGRVPVIAGTGSNSVAESIELTRAAKELGADGALLITPYYNKPTQEGLFQHYQAVSAAVDIPLVLYNVPGRTAVDMQAHTVARLCGIDNIVGVKEATASMERASEIRILCGKEFALISGDDATFLPFLSVGGTGVISVSANVAPKQMVSIWDHWHAGRLDEARLAHETLLELNQRLFCETSPIPVKSVASWMGLCDGSLRLPLTTLSEEHFEPLRRTVTRLGLL